MANLFGARHYADAFNSQNIYEKGTVYGEIQVYGDHVALKAQW